MNVVLIGMPGCGKSTVGVLLAKVMRFGFVDCDLLIQRRYSTSLQNIIDTKGLQCFLQREEDTILRMNEDNAVIATGGSAVYSQKAMEHLKKNSVVVYISLPLEEIEKRLVNIRTRGVAMEKDSTIGMLYEERSPLYEKYADITVNANSQGIEETVEKVAKEIEEYIKNRL